MIYRLLKCLLIGMHKLKIVSNPSICLNTETYQELYPPVTVPHLLSTKLTYTSAGHVSYPLDQVRSILPALELLPLDCCVNSRGGAIQ